MPKSMLRTHIFIWILHIGSNSVDGLCVVCTCEKSNQVLILLLLNSLVVLLLLLVVGCFCDRLLICCSVGHSMSDYDFSIDRFDNIYKYEIRGNTNIREDLRHNIKTMILIFTYSSFYWQKLLLFHSIFPKSYPIPTFTLPRPIPFHSSSNSLFSLW